MIDLDSVLAIIDGYDARMKLAREYFDRRKPVPEEYKQYLAPLEDEDVVKAFEALRPLVARVRELEFQLGEVEFDNSGLYREIDALKRQKDWLAEFISNAFAGITPAKQFIEWAEEAAKEATSHVNKL